jgi:hypothetical protein
MGIVGGVLLATSIVVLVAVTSSSAAMAPPPAIETALPQLVAHDDPTAALPQEVVVRTIKDSANMLLTSDSQEHILLQAGSGKDSLNRRRDVCVVYDVDPDYPEWRPAVMIDAAAAKLKDEVPQSSFNYMEIAFDLEILTPKHQFVCWVDAVKPNEPSPVVLEYRTTLGEWKVLDNDAAPSGFAPIPDDAAVPLELNLL